MSQSLGRFSFKSLTACVLLALSTASQAQSAADDQYRLGLYQRETGLPYASIETLESLLAANPTLNRARLELAVAYHRTLDYARARAEAQRVLNDPSTPETVRLSISSFLKQIELEERANFGQPHRFEPSVSLGLIYDSNVNAGPDSTLLGSFNGGDLILDSAYTNQSDWGSIAQAELRHTWQRPSPVRVLDQPSRVLWTSSLGVYHKGYKQFNEYDLGVVTLATGPALVVGNSWRGNLNLQLDDLYFGGKHLGLYTSISPSGTWKVGRSGELTLDAQWVKRDFHRPGDSAREGQYRSVGASYGRLMGNQTWSMQTGVRLFEESAREDRFSYTGDEWFVGARTQLAGIDLFARAAWRNARYIGVEPVFGVSRRETERRVELGASYTFETGLMEKWQLAATLANVHNKANLTLYGYDRDTVTINLNRSF